MVMKNNNIVVHTDGGSRGNPGPAASAFIIEQGDNVLKESAKYLGKVTNNIAEYNGVILALQWLNENKEKLKLSNKQITFILDSELVVKQINGLYRVKDETLRMLFYKVLDLIKHSGSNIIFKHVLRAENKIADLLVNQELDANV